MRGATVGDQVRPQSELISIHAPLAGCDIDDLIPYANNAKFQSTHLSRGATRRSPRRDTSPRDFNPRAPCGARLGPERHQHGHHAISIHAPHAGRDANAEANERHDDISIHAPHAGRDWSTCSRVRLSITFQSTRPMRGATGAAHYYALTQTISIPAPHAGRDSRKHAAGMKI